MNAELPSPRPDGLCVDCVARDAVTRDRRYCKKCLNARIREEIPIPTHVSEQRGRKARSSAVLAGAPDMRSTEELDEDS